MAHVKISVIFFCVVGLATTAAMAQDQPGVAGKPAGIDTPEIVKQLPTDVKSLRDDPAVKSGPGNLVKQKDGAPVLDKNVNTGQGGAKQAYEKPKPKNTRGSSDEGGDLEDLEIQR